MHLEVQEGKGWSCVDGVERKNNNDQGAQRQKNEKKKIILLSKMLLFALIDLNLSLVSVNDQ